MPSLFEIGIAFVLSAATNALLPNDKRDSFHFSASRKSIWVPCGNAKYWAEQNGCERCLYPAEWKPSNQNASKLDLCFCRKRWWLNEHRLSHTYANVIRNDETLRWHCNNVPQCQNNNLHDAPDIWLLFHDIQLKMRHDFKTLIRIVCLCIVIKTSPCDFSSSPIIRYEAKAKLNWVCRNFASSRITISTSIPTTIQSKCDSFWFVCERLTLHTRIAVFTLRIEHVTSSGSCITCSEMQMETSMSIKSFQRQREYVFVIKHVQRRHAWNQSYGNFCPKLSTVKWISLSFAFTLSIMFHSIKCTLENRVQPEWIATEKNALRNYIGPANEAKRTLSVQIQSNWTCELKCWNTKWKEEKIETRWFRFVERVRYTQTAKWNWMKKKWTENKKINM